MVNQIKNLYQEFYYCQYLLSLKYDKRGGGGFLEAWWAYSIVRILYLFAISIYSEIERIKSNRLIALMIISLIVIDYFWLYRKKEWSKIKAWASQNKEPNKFLYVFSIFFLIFGLLSIFIVGFLK